MSAIACHPRRRRSFAPISHSQLMKKIKNPFRETPSPLKSLKTAKSSYFPTQRYQLLSKTHDFAGETFSFRFAPFSFRVGRTAQRAGDRENLENPSTRENSFFGLVTP
jgi:hypothetical protein